jgi:hypothetical protein
MGVEWKASISLVCRPVFAPAQILSPRLIKPFVKVNGGSALGDSQFLQKVLRLIVHHLGVQNLL